MRLYAEVLGRETQGHCAVEGLKRAHLAIEPGFSIRPEPVSPTDPRSQIANAKTVHPFDCGIESRIFVVEPLTKPHAFGELVSRRLRSAVFAEESHVVMTVICTSF